MFTVDEIINITQGKWIGGPRSKRVTSVSTDSRAVKSRALFVAIKGPRFDGHDFLAHVKNEGAHVALIERDLKSYPDGLCVIKVKNTVDALGQLAASYRLRFNIPVIGITGSAGKTTTKDMLAKVLATRYRVHVNERSLNNHLGVPLTILGLKARHQILIAECGTNQPGDIAYLANILRPTITLFTVIGESHLERLHTLDGVLKEKWHLCDHLPSEGRIYVNGDDPRLNKMKDPRIIRVGNHPRCQWPVKAVIDEAHKRIIWKTPLGELKFKYVSQHLLTNAFLVLSCAEDLECDPAKMRRVIENFRLLPGRGETFLAKGCTVIDDAYNANPLSMRGALAHLALYPKAKRRVAILGDMLELGSEARNAHDALGQDQHWSQVDMLIAVGPLARRIGQQARRKFKGLLVLFAKDAQEAGLMIKSQRQQHDVILIKGSHGVHLDLVVKQFKQGSL